MSMLQVRRKTTATRRNSDRRPIKLLLEPLEERVMLDGNGFPPSIVVGRALSSYTVAGAQNNQLKITYSVYNQESQNITGVLLTTTLSAGVSFVDASILPNRNGQELAWSLGTLPAFGRASVEVTVGLNPTLTQQIDTGSATFATLDARAVSDTAPAAALRNQVIDPALLAATVDANSNDPFIQEQAAKLDYDPNRIFAFLRDEVGYESYIGSLRGARGTLWSTAGNSVDTASLGVALMRSSGIPAQYVQGSLPIGLQQQIILSMFSTSAQSVGLIPAGTPTSNPLGDQSLYADNAQFHTWFQFDTGDGQGLRDADPVVPSAAIGQSFTVAQRTFAEVPDDQRHKTEIKLTAEMWSQASALFSVGNGVFTTVVLDQSFNTAELVGRPLTIGHFVTERSVGALVFASKTTVYTPYIQLGDDAFPDFLHDTLTTGTDYQEVITNFPLGTQVVTGLFLQVKTTDTQGTSTSVERALVDRIGFAARQGLAAPNVAIDPSGPPTISPLDITTISVLPAERLPRYASTANLGANALDRFSEFAEGFGALTEQEKEALIDQGIFRLRELFTYALRSRIADLEGRIAESNRALARSLGIASYLVTPRITIGSTRMTVATNGTSLVKLNLDLARSTYRNVAAPGQSKQAEIGFNLTRGLVEGQIEAAILSELGAAPGSFTFATSAAAVFAAAETQQIPLMKLEPSDMSRVAALPFTADVRARIQVALEGGKSVVLPSALVMLNGKASIAWLEVDKQTGETTSVQEDGSHGATYEWAMMSQIRANDATSPLTRFGYGFLAGFLQGQFIKTSLSLMMLAVVNSALNPLSWINTLKSYYNALKAQLDALENWLASRDPWFKAGLIAGQAAAVVFKFDPPVPDLLLNPESINVSNRTSNTLEIAANVPSPVGAVGSNLNHTHAVISGDLTAEWTSQDSTYQVLSLNSTNSTLQNANGQTIGAGQVALLTSRPVVAAVTGANISNHVGGIGSLSFYGPAENSLGVSGQWRNYTATVSGTSTITISSDGLMLNGQALPAGTYRIMTSSATLTGQGATSSPNFAGTVALTVQDAAIVLGPTTGNVSAGGQSLEANQGVSIDGYDGPISVLALGDGTDRITLNGSAKDVLSLTANPGAFTTNQNTSFTFQTNLRTSLAGVYNYSVNAPEGWTVAIEANGLVSVTPKPGLQTGNFPIQVIAKSLDNANLVAQAVVEVSITPTLAGVSLSLRPDDLFVVPYAGAEIPSAFQADIHNAGPAADTFELTASNIPAGFSVQLSRSGQELGAGQRGLVGVYLIPDAGQQLPAPGTHVTFTVTARSVTDPNVTASDTVEFTVPEIHGVRITADPGAVNTTPGGSQTARITIQAVGNVDEAVALSSSTSSGLGLSGLSDIALLPGQTVVQSIILAPDSSVPLNSELVATIKADFGSPSAPLLQQTHVFLRVVVPGAEAIANAAAAASQLGNQPLANRLNDLSIALTNLVQQPSDPIAKSQALASLDSILSLLAVDPVLSTFVSPIDAGRDALEAASSVSAVQAAVSQLGAALDDFGASVSALRNTNVTLFLSPNNQSAQPLTPAHFEVILHNIGTETTTYNLSLAGLPASVLGTLGVTSITLVPDEISSPLVVTVTPTSTTELAPFEFSVVASPGGFPAITKSVAGFMTARNEFVSIVSVTTDPPFVDPGQSVQVSARVLNAVNREQVALASFEVRNASNQVIFTSVPVQTTLTVAASLSEIALGSFDTTGVDLGAYTIHVKLTELDGTPIPGGAGTGGLLVGSPVAASLTVDQTIVPPGTTTVTSTLVIDAQTTLVGPLGVVSQTSIPTAEGVVHNGNLVYASGSDGIRVYNATNPASPQLVRTFGTSATKLELHGGKLYALTRFGPQNRFYLRIYSLTDPTDPQLLGSATYNNQEGIPYGLAWHMVVTDTHVFVSLWGFTYLQPNDIKFQIGDIISIDVTDPSAPHFVSALRNTYGTNNDGIGQYLNVDVNGGEGPMWEIEQVDANTLLIAGSTVAGDDTENGSGVVHVIDISDPAHMSIVRSLVIPGTVQAVGLSIEGNRAFVTGSTTGWQDHGTLDFHGNTVLAVLDITDHRNPALLGSQIIDRPSRSPADQFTAALGNGLFVFSSRFETSTTDAPALFVVDATNPQSLVFSNTAIPAFTADVDGFGNYVYTTSSSGLIIYQLDAVDAIPVTAHVDVPKNTGVSIVPGSFSVEPTEVLVGADFDTLVFHLNLTAGATSQTITWRSTLTGIEPGSARDVTLGTTIDFTSQGTDGHLTLPNTRVAVAQILSMTPASQTVRPGESSSFAVTINNPTNSARTFSLSVVGVPDFWSQIAPEVTVPANASRDVPLTITSDAFALLGAYGFVVTASDGFAGSVQGTVTLVGDPVIPVAQPESHGVVLALTPELVTTGRGGFAKYTLRVTNTGSSTETFHVTVPNLPPGVTADVSNVDVVVPPGASNFREVTVVLSLPLGLNTGSYTVGFAAQSADSNVSASIAGQLAVASLGVTAVMTPVQNNPGGNFQFQVTNTGTQTETFKLSLAGPGALVATLGQSQVTLGPGQSTLVPISTSAANFALPGTLALSAVAESMSNGNVRAAATSNLTIAETKGVLATANPVQINVDQVPGTGVYQILVQNIGNVEDSYQATISSTSGNVIASFIGIDGLPTSSISPFVLPGLGIGALTLQVQLTGPGEGSVQVLIQSLTATNVASAAAVHITHLDTPVPTNLQLTVSPNSPKEGDALVLTAIITPGREAGVLAGSVIFSIDGMQVTPVQVVHLNGVYQATTTITGVAAGQHLVSAEFSGGGNYSGGGATSNITVQAAPISNPPRVVRVDRFGFHARPTTLAIAFDRALDPTTAQDIANYLLRGPGGPIRILWAIYDPETFTVLLRPSRRLPLSGTYHLTAFGNGVASVLGQNGAKLDGDSNGVAGGNFVTTINRKSLVKTMPQRIARNTLTYKVLSRASVPMGPRAVTTHVVRK